MTIYPQRSLDTGIRLAIDIEQCQALKDRSKQDDANSYGRECRRENPLMSLTLRSLPMCKSQQESSRHQGKKRIDGQHIAHEFDIEITCDRAINNHPGEYHQPGTSIALPCLP